MTESADLFAREFGGDPDGAWRAPGRVNLIGEHTDYNAGFVLPVAIDRTTTATLRLRADRRIRVTSTFASEVVVTSVDALTEREFDGWSAYPLGVAWALGEVGADLAAVPGFDLALASDVPVGAGLSSSAAIEMATAVALNEQWQLGLGRMDLARAGQLGENVAVGAPTGLMDQVASLFGEPDAAVFLDCRSLEVQAVPLGFAAADLVLVVIDTGVRHEHASGGYRARRESCERAARELHVPALRDVGIDDLAAAQRILDIETFRRVRHVVTENGRVLDAVRALREGEHTGFGRLMSASHASLRDDFDVSVPELDLAVATALDAGALGARLTGGGFGGAAVALTPVNAAADLLQRVASGFAAAGFTEPHAFTVTATATAGGIRAGSTGGWSVL